VFPVRRFHDHSTNDRPFRRFGQSFLTCRDARVSLNEAIPLENRVRPLLLTSTPCPLALSTFSVDCPGFGLNRRENFCKVPGRSDFPPCSAFACLSYSSSFSPILVPPSSETRLPDQLVYSRVRRQPPASAVSFSFLRQPLSFLKPQTS